MHRNHTRTGGLPAVPRLIRFASVKKSLHRFLAKSVAAIIMMLIAGTLADDRCRATGQGRRSDIP